MNVRKLVVLGVLAVIAATLTTADAQAFGKRKRQQSNCCPQPAPPCNTCGGGMAYGPGAGMPMAMPMPNSSGNIVPASGTTGGAVVPAAGTVIPGTAGNVIPGSSSYYYPSGSYYNQSGSYYYDPATGTYSQYSTPFYGTTQRRGLFRRY
jgi:hypothetical protein